MEKQTWNIRKWEEEKEDWIFIESFTGTEEELLKRFNELHEQYEDATFYAYPKEKEEEMNK